MPNMTSLAPVPNAGGTNSTPYSAAGNGYDAALNSLNKSLGLLKGSDTSQMMQAQGQLAQSQGKTQQNLINSGLGNTSVAQTLQQAPLQTYNQNIQGIQNNLAQQQAGVLGQGAGMQAQSGNLMASLMAQMYPTVAAQQEQQNKRSSNVTYNGGTGV